MNRRPLFLFALLAVCIFGAGTFASAGRREEIDAQIQGIDSKITSAESMRSAINARPGDYDDVPQTLKVLAETLAKLNASKDELLRERAAADAPAPASAAPAAASASKSGPADEAKPFIDKSHFLKKTLEDLKKRRFAIEFRPGAATYVIKRDRLIVISADEEGNAAEVASSLAHEFGHTRYRNKDISPSGLTRAEYVRRKVADNLADEGEATLDSVQAKNEIVANGGPAIDVPGVKAAEYEKIFKKYPAAKDRQKARDEIGAIFSTDETPSGHTGNYADYYAEQAGREYDAWAARRAAKGAGKGP